MSEANSVGMEVRPDLSDLPRIRYATWVTSKPLDESRFIPLESRLSIDDLTKLEAGKVGFITYEVNDFKTTVEGRSYHHRELYATQFFPFSAHPERYAHFLGKGVADLVQLSIAEHLLNQFGNQFKIIHRHPSKTRENQLDRLGIKKDTWYALSEYVEIIKQGVEKR